MKQRVWMFTMALAILANAAFMVGGLPRLWGRFLIAVEFSDPDAIAAFGFACAGLVVLSALFALMGAAGLYAAVSRKPHDRRAHGGRSAGWGGSVDV